MKKTDVTLSVILLTAILGVYWVAILCINLSGNPSFYCTDMYADMQYAVEVWTHKKLFPEGWVFGNQLYVVATPVLASLFYGITQDPCSAMGIASVLMGLGVVGSFYWMMKPVFANVKEKLLALVCFMTVVLASGDPVFSETGWQLFFTMCTYYACYAITAFLAFGCYLRSNEKWTYELWVMLAAACVFSFGTGMQSLRQTAVMILPLIALELVRFLYSKVVRREYLHKAALTTGILTVFNLAGVLLAKSLKVQQKEIFGSVSLQIPEYLLGEIMSDIVKPFSLFYSFQNVAVVLFAVVCIGSLITVFFRKNWVEDAAFLCMLLCIASVAVIVAIDVLTTMNIRDIYYFLLYPMTAICVTWVYARLAGKMKTAFLTMVVVLSLCCVQKLLPYIPSDGENEQFQQVSDYVEEQGITTLYSHWNFGEKVAIASDFRIQAGFWKSRRDPFDSFKCLCNPVIFDVDIANCGYIVRGQDVFERTSEAAQNQGVSIQLLQYFPELDAYLFTANAKLMQ